MTGCVTAPHHAASPVSRAPSGREAPSEAGQQRCYSMCAGKMNHAIAPRSRGVTLSGPMRCRAADRLASYPPGADRANGRGAAWPRLRPEPSQHYAKRQRHLQQVPFCMAGTADGTADGRIVWRPVSRVVRRRARLAPAAKGPGPGRPAALSGAARRATLLLRLPNRDSRRNTETRRKCSRRGKQKQLVERKA